VGHGRQAALGDAISNLMATQGWNVHREFYYNDAGVQIANLALSVQARAQGLEPGGEGWPEQAYNGEYIADIARDFMSKATVAAADGQPVTASGSVDDIESIRQFAVAYLRKEQDIDLQSFGVKFDCYYLESSLYTDGSVASVVNDLQAIGRCYESEGALWLKTTDDGDDKDRVMRKSDGTYTYFVPDVAYHASEWSGGVEPNQDDIQRADAIRRGRDAVRFFLISRKADTEFVFDVDLALKQNDENPVFYVQYAHARICSILRQWGGEEGGLKEVSLESLTGNATDRLLRRLAEYPDVLTAAAQDHAPHALAFYLRDLAGDFHTFYNAERVLVDDESIKLARLALLSATRQVIANGLDVLGVSAPEKM
jgi:arginyl-tRNA synthetase